MNIHYSIRPARTAVLISKAGFVSLLIFASNLGPFARAADAVSHKAAVFVLTHEPKIGIQQVKAFEDVIAARVASQGFQPLTRDMVVDSLASSTARLKENADEVDAKPLLAEFADMAKTASAPSLSMEAQLYAQSSVTRLAQTIGADLIVFATIESFDTEKRVFKGNELAPVATATVSNTLTVSYRLAHAATGGAVAGDSLRVSRAWRESETLSRESDGLVADMLNEAAMKLAEKISITNKQIKDVPAVQTADVNFDVKVTLPGGASLQLPVYQQGEVELPVTTTTPADVILDGIVAGTLPGPVHVATGLHQISVQAQGFKPWKRFINITPGQKISVVLEMSPENYERWKETVVFLSQFTRYAKLTNAEVALLKAKAEAMRKAGLIVTIGSDGAEVIGR